MSNSKVKKLQMFKIVPTLQTNSSIKSLSFHKNQTQKLTKTKEI